MSTLRKLNLTLVRPILEYCCHVWDLFLHKVIELLESIQKFAFRVCTKRWRETHNHLRNLLRLPLLKDRRKKLKLTMVYKCLNGLMVMPSNIFSQWTVQVGTWDPMEAYFCISHLHTQIVIYILVSQVLCPYGTNCLRTFTTVSPFLLLNPLSIISIILFDTIFFWVNFALYSLCYLFILCVHIIIYIPKDLKKH